MVYELRLKTINKGYLVPFYYYGIYDTDYSVIIMKLTENKEDELKALRFTKEQN